MREASVSGFEPTACARGIGQLFCPQLAKLIASPTLGQPMRFCRIIEARALASRSPSRSGREICCALSSATWWSTRKGTIPTQATSHPPPSAPARNVHVSSASSPTAPRSDEPGTRTSGLRWVPGSRRAANGCRDHGAGAKPDRSAGVCDDTQTPPFAMRHSQSKRQP